MHAVLLLAAACLVATAYGAPTPPKSADPAPQDVANALPPPGEARQIWSPEQLKEQMAGVQVDETAGADGDMETDESRWGGRGWGGGYGYGRGGWGYGGYRGGWGGGYGGGWRRGGWGGYGGYNGYGYGRSYYRPYFGGSWGFYG